MEHGSRQQQIPVEVGVGGGQIIAHPGYVIGVLQQSSHKTVVYALCGGSLLELVGKLDILHKDILAEDIEMGLADLVDKGQQLLVHLVYLKPADGEIIRGIVLTFEGLFRPLDIDLNGPVKEYHFAGHIYVIQLIKILYASVGRLPDLCVCRAGLILQGEVHIRFAVLGGCVLTVLNQINVRYPVSFSQLIDVFHTVSPLLISSTFRV